MRIADVEHIIEEWAPKWVAWERDNVGLQVGDSRRSVSGILIALDVTESVIEEAARKNAELIVSHHPLLFRPPKAVTANDDVGRLILLLAEKKIALYSAHTNLDFTKEGVSVRLARVLGLQNVRFLSPLKSSLAKIVVFVPEGYADRIVQAMSASGAGVIGEYSNCSFRVAGRGSFTGSASSNPTVGARGRLELVDEVRIEMLCPRASVETAVAAMKAIHPYEEVACDVYPVENRNTKYGMGAVGELRTRQTLGAFLAKARRALSAKGLRYNGSLRQTVQRVAVCGGSGSELLADAVREGADVFLTADVRYHTFHAAKDRIALVDAGHWETEHMILSSIAERIRVAVKKRRKSPRVFVTKHSTNPVQYV